FNVAQPTQIYTLSLHDALPIYDAVFRDSRIGPSFCRMRAHADNQSRIFPGLSLVRRASHNGIHRVPKRIITHGPFLLRRVEEDRSEEHTSELQSLTNIVCRLLL